MAHRVTHCLICGDTEPFPAIFKSSGFTLVKCGHCGLVFQDPQPSDEILEASYYFDPEFTKSLYGEMRSWTLDRAREKLDLLSPVVGTRRGRLLDVGCSSGAWLEVAAEAGWEATGVEIGDTTAGEARSRGLDVRNGTLEQLMPALCEERFDVITFWDVLEHLRDPRAELDRAAGLLAKNGVLAATFPNIDGWFPRATYRLLAHPTGVWEYPELPLHLFDFSTTTAATLFEKSGFEVVASATWGTPFAHFRGTTLSWEVLGRNLRGRAVRAAYEILHVVLYPMARLLNRGNAQFIAAIEA